MHKDDITYLQRAIELAAEHSQDGRHGPFGAVIVKDGEIIAEGWNAVVDSHYPTAHAEVAAIRAAARRLGTHELNDCTIYASCEPCPMCLAAIYWARIDRVVYAATKEDAAEIGFDDSMLYEEMARDWNERRLDSAQALRGPAREAMQAWATNPKKLHY